MKEIDQTTLFKPIDDAVGKLKEGVASLESRVRSMVVATSDHSCFDHPVSKALKAAAEDFCQKVESGRARSVDSYNKFSAALALWRKCKS